MYEEDYFALVEFDDQIGAWKNTLSKATKENVSEAMAYVKRLGSRGGEEKTSDSNPYQNFFLLLQQ